MYDNEIPCIRSESNISLIVIGQKIHWNLHKSKKRRKGAKRKAKHLILKLKHKSKKYFTINVEM